MPQRFHDYYAYYHQLSFDMHATSSDAATLHSAVFPSREACFARVAEKIGACPPLREKVYEECSDRLRDVLVQRDDAHEILADAVREAALHVGDAVPDLASWDWEEALSEAETMLEGKSDAYVRRRRSPPPLASPTAPPATPPPLLLVPLAPAPGSPVKRSAPESLESPATPKTKWLVGRQAKRQLKTPPLKSATAKRHCASRPSTPRPGRLADPSLGEAFCPIGGEPLKRTESAEARFTAGVETGADMLHDFFGCLAGSAPVDGPMLDLDSPAVTRFLGLA